MSGMDNIICELQAYAKFPWMVSKHCIKPNSIYILWFMLPNKRQLYLVCSLTSKKKTNYKFYTVFLSMELKAHESLQINHV